MPETKPTDDDYEREKGRVAVWLDPDDIRWLAGFLAGTFDEQENERIGRLRFRLLATIHKSGLPNTSSNDELSDEESN